MRARIAEHGDRRREALEIADNAKEEILKLAPAALKAGINVKELAELGAVSRPTLYSRLELGRDQPADAASAKSPRRRAK
jgi:hypothetical protein